MEALATAPDCNLLFMVWEGRVGQVEGGICALLVTNSCMRAISIAPVVSFGN